MRPGVRKLGLGHRSGVTGQGSQVSALKNCLTFIGSVDDYVDVCVSCSVTPLFFVFR